MVVRVLTIAALILLGARAQNQQSLPGDPEQKKLLQRLCGQCHKLDMVTNRRLTKEAWQKTVQAMVDKGADATDDEFNAVINYLAKYFGPKLNVNKATVSELAAFLDVAESQAASIVKYRESNGSFKTWQDVTKIPGVDAKKIESQKERLDF